jgi:hypothetical protein
MATEFPNSFKDPLYSQLDARTEAKLGLPPGLLVSIRINGEKSNHDQTNHLKTATVYQFIPATRDAILKKYGIDVTLSPENASEGAGLLLKEGLDRNKGDASQAVGEYIGGLKRDNWGSQTKAYINRVMVGQNRENTKALESGFAQFMAANPAVPEGRAMTATPAPNATPEAAKPNALEAGFGDFLAQQEKAVSDAKYAAPESGIIDRIKDVVTGELRQTDETQTLPEWTGMPEMNQLSMASMKAGAGTMFAPSAEIPKILKAQFPNMEIRADAKGNSILKSPSDGKEYIIPPGLTMGDLPRVIGGVAAFTPAGRALTLPGQMAGAAATQAAIEGTQAATGGEFNTTDVALAGAAAPVAALVAKGVGGTVQGVKNVLQKSSIGSGKPMQAAVNAVPETVAPVPVMPQAVAPQVAETTIAPRGVVTFDRQRMPYDEAVDRPVVQSKIENSFTKDEYSTAYEKEKLYATSALGGTTKRNFAEIKAIGGTPSANKMFVDSKGDIFTGQGTKASPLRAATPDEIAISKAELIDESIKTRAGVDKSHWQRFVAEADSLADYAAENGINVKRVIPDDSNSQYLYLESPKGKAKIRFADHQQPYGTRPDGTQGPVGGYSQKTKTRHEASDISIAPGEQTINDAKALIAKLAADKPPTAAPLVAETTIVAPAATSTAEAIAPKTTEELADLARKAATGTFGKTKATEQLAAQASPSKTVTDAAQRLKMELDPEFVTDNEQFRKLMGLMASRAGSEAEARSINVVKNAADRAETALAELGATKDIASISDKVKGSLAATRNELEKSSDALYKEIDDAIPKSTPVQLPTLTARINKVAEDMGGVSGLSSQEKALSSMLSEPVTYGRLARERGLIGKALAGKESPYGSMEEGTLKQLYSSLAEDQLNAVNAIGGEAMRDKYRLASQTVAKRKDLEKQIVETFGRDGNGSLVSSLRNGIASSIKGDDKGLNKLLKVIPPDMQKEAMSTALLNYASSSTKGGQFGFPQFEKMYRGMRDNSPVYAAVVKSLGPNANEVLTDLYQVSRAIAKAQDAVLYTGKANQAILNNMKGAETLVGKVLEGAKSAAARGAAMEVATSLAVGPTGAGFMAGAVQAAATPRKDVAKAIGELLTSPEFKEVIQQVVKKGEAPPHAVTRLAKAKAMRGYGQYMGETFKRDITEREAWINSAIQSGRPRDKDKSKL